MLPNFAAFAAFLVACMGIGILIIGIRTEDDDGRLVAAAYVIACALLSVALTLSSRVLS